MRNERLEELRKREAEENRERQREIEVNPLSQYSTTQLKEELRKRKRQCRNY